jgi:signal transduction histidine kinase
MRGYKLGAVDYVMVPVIPEILRSKVVVLAELFRKRRELQLANERLAAANEALRTERRASWRCSTNPCAWPTWNWRSATSTCRRRSANARAPKAQLRELDRRKDEFLATLAHELRNPLAPLRNAVSIRKLTGSDDPMQHMMERQLGLLVRLIDDLLDVARISRGKLVLKPSRRRCRTSSMPRSKPPRPCSKPARTRCRSRCRKCRCRCWPMANASRRCSPTCSAMRPSTSDAGRPIELVAQRSGQFVAVSVRDRGIGLTRDQISEVFELFAQVDTSVERARGGLGIGLTLVKQLVEMHGGNIAWTAPAWARAAVSASRCRCAKRRWWKRPSRPCARRRPRARAASWCSTTTAMRPTRWR